MEISFNILLHVLTGIISVLAGSIALFSKKGSRVHKLAGKVFFVSMLIVAGEGALLAYLKPEMISVLAGVFTGYLVATSFVTIKTPAGKVTVFDYFAPAIALFVGIAGIIFGMEAMGSESGLKDGFTAEPYFFFAALALLALCLDVRMLFSQGISGAHRIARHLWRMCFAFYIAVGSLFTQGAKVFPESVRDSAFISIPENVVAILMVFWLARVLLAKKKNNRQTTSTEAVELS